MDKEKESAIWEVVGAFLLLALCIYTTLHLWKHFVMPVTGWPAIDVSGVLFLSALVAVYRGSATGESSEMLVQHLCRYVIIWIVIGVAHWIR
jgi:hypothetical protein